MFPSKQRSARDFVLEALRVRRQDVGSLAAEFRTRFPDDLLGRWLAAKAAVQQGDRVAAIRFYSELPSDGGVWEFQRELGLGQRYFAAGDLVETERHLSRAVELNPYHLEANERLGHMLQICGRVWESAPHFLVQLQRGKCRGDELLGASYSDHFFRMDERYELLGADFNSPAFPVRLAQARRSVFENRESEAESLLRKLVAAYPQLGEAQGRLGRLIVDRGDYTEFLRWRGSLTEEARRHPEVLFAEGVEARRLGLLNGAVHCFFEVLKLSPNHLGAHTQIAGCLDQLGRNELAHEFSQRGILLSEVDRNFGILRNDVRGEMVYETVQLLGRLGRYWEAAGWCYVSKWLDERPDWSDRELARWVSCIDQRTLPELRPMASIRPADYDSPRWPVPEGRLSPSAASEHSGADWNFSEIASAIGLDFTYFEGTDEPNRLTHIFNVMGGGLGAIDYDLDGWIDLYIAQGHACAILSRSRSGSIVCTGTSTENAARTSRIPPA